MEKQQTSTATVNEFFTWYAGPDWKEDCQITNTMTIDGVHAQDGDDEEVVKRLVELENEAIEITSTPDPSAWDISFTLDGKEYELQAASFYGDTEEV
jgi:hypothetical protein